MLTEARKPSIVAVIASLRDFDDIPSRSFDLQVRIDKLLPSSDDLILHSPISLPEDCNSPGSAEGSANSISESTRLSLFERWLPVCNFIDVEARNLSRFPR